MKVVIILSCLVAVGFAFPFSNHVETPSKRAGYHDVADAIQRSQTTLNNRKRNAGVNELFTLMDTNRDGHINREEFSSFYGTYGPLMGFSLSKAQWAAAFDQTMQASYVDLNDNDMLEPNELLILHNIGTGKK